MSKKTFVRDATGLLKEFSAMDALAMALSNIGLTYVFDVCTYPIAAYPAENALVTTALALVLALPMILLFMTMTIAMPRTGGDYVWVSRTLWPSIGFICSFVNTIMWLSFVGDEFPVSILWGASSWVYSLGLVYKSQYYIGLAKYLTTPDVVFWLSVLQTIIAGVIVLYSTRITRAVVRYWTYWAVIVLSVFVIMILATGQSTFMSNFNALSGANYDQVIRDGQAAGAYAGVPPVFSTATLFGGSVRMLGIIGFNASVYFAGEVKNVQKSQYIGQFGTAVLFVAVETVVITTMYYGMGPSFANAMAVLWGAGSSKFPWVTVPQTAGLSIFWVPNPFLASLFSLTYIGSGLIISLAILFTYTRNLFAWSFDRLMPAALADINPKTATPFKATIVMLLIAIFFDGVVSYAWGPLATTLSFATGGIIIVYMVIGIAGIVFPYRRRDLFESSHPVARKKIGGIPIMSILGLLTIASGLFIEYSIFLPALSNFTVVFATGVLPTFVLGAIIYAIVWTVRKRQGINLDFVGKTIPPE